MRCEVPTDRWITSRPFWEHLGEQGHRVCIVDVPMILGKPRPVNGLYLGGWGTHDLISSGAWPSTLWNELRRRHGQPIMPKEHFGPQTAGALESLTASLLRSTEQMQRIATDLLGRERWDFACVVFGATHRVGHYLWDLSQLDSDTLPASRREALETALLSIYQATDHAIARVLDQVGDDTLVITFALHGMGPNPGWSDLVPEILEAAHHSSTGQVPSKGLLYALRRRLPMQWIRPLIERLPMSVTDRLVSLWSARMFDWTVTTQFPVPMDHAGYLRINLQGRERDGIVAGTAAYTEACAAIERVFLGLRDRDTGRCIAQQVVHAFAQAPPSASYRDLMPDLIVQWQDPAATQSRELYCDAAPSLHFTVPRRLPSGRSGNHTGRGWFIACGPGVARGQRLDGHDILDLAPTVLAYLGADCRPEFQGRPMDLHRGRIDDH
jgi:predicted AlkP superfamily phosphohydrolase/phosphomutase